MSLEFKAFKSELKEGDFFQCISFGSPLYFVIDIIKKDEEIIEFYGLKFSKYGLYLSPLIENSMFKERRQTIAPSPFDIYRNSEMKIDVLKNYVFDERLIIK